GVGGAYFKRPTANSKLVREDAAVGLGVFEDGAGPTHDGRQRILRHEHRQLRPLAEVLVEPLQQRAAAGEHDPALEHVAAELGRRRLERAHDGGGDLVDGRAERLAHVLGRDHARLGHARDEVAPLHVELELGVHLRRAPDLALDPLGRPRPDQQVVVLLEVLHDGGVELVAAGADGLVDDDARERDDGDLGGAPADVDDHVADGLVDVEADPDGRRHRLVDELDLLGAGVLRRVADGPLLDLGDPARHADHHAADARERARLDPLDEPLDEVLGHLEVRDDAVVEGPDRLDVLVRALVHVERLDPDGLDLPRRAADGDDGGLVEDDPLVADVDQRVGGAEVDGDVDREGIEHRGGGVSAAGVRAEPEANIARRGAGHREMPCSREFARRPGNGPWRPGTGPPDPISARAQCRKCRLPVNTLASPRSFAAAITSASRTLPPGWMAAVAPASAAATRPSANGKNASLATTQPAKSSSDFRPFDTAISLESTRLICPAPMPRVAPPRA